jgi:integrase
MITIRQQKTDNPVQIPIHPVFREIWERYGGLPLVISNQKFNDHIKDVCKAARINETVLKSITKGGKRITTSYKKWQLVSSHTARRSFATNLYRQGFPSIGIMSITGHKTETAFLKYIKVGKEEHAEMLMKHWQKLSK